MNDKYKDLWVVFLCIGTLFFMISTTIDITWIKLTLITISILLYVISLIFSIKKYNNKNKNNES